MPTAMPAGAVGEQVREQARKDLGLLLLAIVGRAEGDRAFVEPGHQLARRRGQPRLGVAHRRGIIAVDIAEIALPVDERVAEREILGEPDHRVVDRLVAVRVIFADHVADHARAFLVARRRIELSSRIAQSSRRCTGFSPSRRSGSDRAVIVERA